MPGAQGEGEAGRPAPATFRSYSQGSRKTSSTATTTTATMEDTQRGPHQGPSSQGGHEHRLQPRDGPRPTRPASWFTSGYRKSLPTGSFGSLPIHATLLQNYKDLVLHDAAFRSVAGASTPIRGKRVNAQEIAKSVGWMTLRSQGQYGFLKDLFKLVFGFHCEDADTRKSVTIAGLSKPHNELLS